jgi:hypothetical protein
MNKKRVVTTRPVGVADGEGPVEAPAVAMVEVVRDGCNSNGGPVTATIPATSLPSWARNGWRVKE